MLKRVLFFVYGVMRVPMLLPFTRRRRATGSAGVAVSARTS